VSAALDLVGVSKDYRGLRPLRIERLTVAGGERVAILGLDQASAEVLVNLLTGATLPDQGRVSVLGRSTADIADGAEWLASVDRLGLVTERAILLEELDVVQNLAIPFTLDIEPPPDDVRGRAVALAEEVGLEEAAWNRPVARLDAAGRMRVRLARALAFQPALLLLEHASAGLAVDEASALGAAVRSAAARRGAALIALTADERFARAVADRVLEWRPATGALVERRQSWFGRLLG
jgi:putative ABC transport system ATP-binding protein